LQFRSVIKTSGDDDGGLGVWGPTPSSQCRRLHRDKIGQWTAREQQRNQIYLWQIPGNQARPFMVSISGITNVYGVNRNRRLPLRCDYIFITFKELSCSNYEESWQFYGWIIMGRYIIFSSFWKHTFKIFNF